MKIINTLLVSSAIGGLLFLNSCKDDNPDKTNVPDSGLATFHAEFQCTGIEDHDDLVLEKTYLNANGDSVSFSEVRYWLSNIQLVREDGSVWSEKDSYRLIERSAVKRREEFMFEIPTGKYKAIRFGVGVDKNRNSSIDSIQGELDVSKGMSWTWNSGYIFFKTEGYFYNTNTQAKELWQYHIGTDANYKTVELTFPATLTIESGKEAHMHTILKTLELFSNPNAVYPKDNPVLKMMPATETAKVAENINSFFELHHLTVD